MLIFNSNTTHLLLRASLGCSVAAGPSETSSSVLGGPPPALRICRLVTAHFIRISVDNKENLTSICGLKVLQNG
ncbi:hypothetical protein V5799_015436 [Amblyomma americanum]|uniref:Secreted protein n=1 Tax=Amblyomma americanum TaxID=6943 RepID=A0AAQ4F8N5_AMBAM